MLNCTDFKTISPKQNAHAGYEELQTEKPLKVQPLILTALESLSNARIIVTPYLIIFEVALKHAIKSNVSCLQKGSEVKNSMSNVLVKHA